MTVTYQAMLERNGTTDEGIQVPSFSLQEEMGSGWIGVAVLRSSYRSLMSSGEMLALMSDLGIYAGAVSTLRLAGLFSGEDGIEDGSVALRSWPSVITHVEPYNTREAGAFCRIRLVDPVTYLADQQLWGAYRGVSLGNIVGGALSIAAGGDGRPTLDPVLPGLPRMRVVEEFREARSVLQQLSYAVAAGRTLGQWLGEVFSGAAVSSRLRVAESDRIEMVLQDGIASEKKVRMQVIDGTKKMLAPSSLYHAKTAMVTGYRVLTALPDRSASVDNPEFGPTFRTSELPSTGTVITATDAGFLESVWRHTLSKRAELVENFQVGLKSRQASLLPGRCLDLYPTLLERSTWQVARVAHRINREVYDNDATLLAADFPWVPQASSTPDPIYVSGVVDGGPKYQYGDLVPKDRLGRVRIIFAFHPQPLIDEVQRIAQFDTTRDLRIRLDDFTEEQITDYTDNEMQWNTRLDQLQDGTLQEPFPGVDPDELSPEERAIQEDYEAEKDAVERYQAYLDAKAFAEADRDMDGFISKRDVAVSDHLSETLEDASRRNELHEQWLQYYEAQRTELDLEEAQQDDLDAEDDQQIQSEAAGTVSAASDNLASDLEPQGNEGDDSSGDGASGDGASDGVDETDYFAGWGDSLTDEQKALVEEYDTLFEGGASRNPGDAEAFADAEIVSERWPPRIPASGLEPMAGALHGSVQGHRHGDICRLVVRDPFTVEVLGAEYRADRQINPSVTAAVAGTIVDHNASTTWSGLVFSRSELLETASPELIAAPNNYFQETAGTGERTRFVVQQEGQQDDSDLEDDDLDAVPAAVDSAPAAVDSAPDDDADDELAASDAAPAASDPLPSTES